MALAPACRYLIIKLFPDFSLQAFFNLYFWLIGSVAVAGNILPPLRRLVRNSSVLVVLHRCQRAWKRWQA